MTPISRRKIARVGGPTGSLLTRDIKGRWYLDGKLIDNSQGVRLQWSAKWVYSSSGELCCISSSKGE